MNPNIKLPSVTQYTSNDPHPPPPAMRPLNPNITLHSDTQYQYPVSHLQNGVHYAFNPPSVDPYVLSAPYGLQYVYPRHHAVDAGSVTGQSMVDNLHLTMQHYSSIPTVSAPQSLVDNPHLTMQQYSSIPTYCEVCKIGCNTEDVLNKHRLGRRHKKNLDKLTGCRKVYCEVCEVGCDTNDVLKQHYLKNKHKKNLDKLKAALPQRQSQPQPQKNPSSGKRSKEKAVESKEELEKKRKVLEGAAAVNAPRTCPVCNVFCNSEVVFISHLTGAKHSAMVKKLRAGTTNK